MPKLRTKLCARDVEKNPDAGKVIASAKAVINLVVHAQGVHEKHMRHVVDSMLWRITIAPYRHKRQGGQAKHDLVEGDKTATRYCSKDALDLLKKGQSKDVQHEHVYGKKWMIDRILKLATEANPEKNISKFLNDHAIACCVTRSEHGRLNGQPSHGPKRYKSAKGGPISVWDRIEDKEAKFK